MTLGIRTKLVGTLILAGLLPLALFLTVILTGALSVRTNSIGSAFRTHARLQADHLVALVSSQTEFVWMLGHMPEPREMLRAANERPFDQEGTDALEERWPSLSPDAPELQAILDNDVARQWQSIQSQQPRFAEVLITDLKGRLVAATNKTSDYYQADEPWWHDTHENGHGRVLLTDVLLDESAIARTGRRGAVVANLCMPIYDTDAPGSPLIGIMKVSFDAGWVVEQLESAVSPGYAAAEIWLVNASGTRVIELTEGERRLPVVPNTLMERIRSGQRGWIKDSPIKGRELVGFAEVKMRRGRIASDVEWYVIVAASREEALGPLYRLAWYVVVGGICLVTLCFLAGWFIARREIIEPLMALRHGAAELERGNVGYRLELSPQNASVFRQDEIGQLARDFNRMADELQRNLTRLETADEVKRQFIDLASHELRTPVTYILGVAQLAQRTNSSEAPLLAKIAVKAARLSRIVENMFKLVSSGTWDARLRMTEVDVAFLLQGVIQELEPFMRERRQTLTTDVAPDLPKILADGEKIRDVLANLLSNAVRFSPDGQNISVRIQAKDNGVFLSVHNPGPGISEADSANLFEPFFTGGQTSTHTSGEFAYQSRGIGLGLSVVQRFVQMHHGTVAWRNENGGTTFDVYLPAKPPVP